MSTLRVRWMCVVIVVCGSAVANAMSLDEAMGRLQTYKLGQENGAINTIREAAAGSFHDPATRQKLLTGLTAILASDATTDAKHFVCRQLALIGTEAEVPVLAKLLTDPELSQVARYALARIPSGAADRALMDALSRTEGANRLGIINTLGSRQWYYAVKPLAELLRAADKETASEAARALGRMDAPEALRVLEEAFKDPKSVDLEVIADAYLNCAELSGNPLNVISASMAVMRSKAPSHVRGAAVIRYTQASNRTDGVISFLKSEDRQLQVAAAHAAVDVKGPEEIQALAAASPDLPARSQMLLIHALAGRRERSVAAAVTNACESQDPAVRVAALEVLGTVGDVSSIPLLLKRTKSRVEAERTAASEALKELPGDDINGALISRLDTAVGAEKAEIVAALTKRNATEAVPTLLELAKSDDGPPYGWVPLGGLRGLAGPEHIPAIVDLLGKKDASYRNEVRKMLVWVVARCAAQRQASVTLAAKLAVAKDQGTRVAILETLGDLGDSSGLAAVRKALSDPDEKVRSAAISALGGWFHGESLPDLLQIARDERASPGDRGLALRQYVDLLRLVESMKPDEKTRCYRMALSLASSSELKMRIFAGLSGVKTLEAMQLAVAGVQDEQVREEAALATVAIAKDIYGGNMPPVKAALERVLAANVRSTTKEQAQKVLGEIEAARSYLMDWEVSGPYMEKGKSHSQLFDTPFEPEKPKARVEWRKMPVSTNGPHPGYCDLLKELKGGEQRVAYLRTQIESEDLKAVTLEIFSDDGVKAWLNNKVVHGTNVARPIMPQPDRVTVTLQKGVNRLMLKVTQNNLPWGAIVRVREAQAAEAKVGEGFKLHVINADSRFEAAGVLDVNRDGKLDIFCGGFWYEAPDWKRHFVREVKEEGNYFYDFANLPMDVDGDGWVDIANAAWHNKMVFWVRNPGPKGGPWEVFEIDTPGNMETALAYDINGDGQLDVLPNIMTAAAWYEYRRDALAPGGARWEKHSLPKEGAGHGNGAGDINRDGRCDIVVTKGWLEQAATGWQWHPEFDLGHASVPILVHDVDGDGDADLIWGLGHNYGLFWLEQTTKDGQRAWEKHLIDESWSQPHYLLLADLDNDGKAELVTGKRYYAHNGNDPGANDPVCIYYYKFDAAAKRWTRHTIHEGGRVGFGINTMVADIDGDGDLDIVAPGKSGLYLLENIRK